MDLKDFALQLCTCTSIEIMTGLGITLYLMYLQNYNLAELTVALFAPLIAFHFAIDKLSRDWRQEKIKIRPSKRKLFN